MEILMDAADSRPASLFSETHQLKNIDAVFGIMDFYTRDHARRVAIYAMRLARRVGLPPEEVENIALGGLLHDIGKVGLSPRIFRNKEATLSAEMQEEIRQHPSIGVSLLKGIEFPTPVLDYVYYHHERGDGSGYPCGLTADKIPLGAKIISVADCFDAITTDRSYQKGKNRKDAFAILKKARGNGFCPGLVEAFIEEVKENGMVAIWPPRRLESELSALSVRR